MIRISSPTASRAAAAETTPEDRLRYATLLVEVGELWDAEVEADEALEERPDDVGALDLLAKIKHLRGQLSEALAYWGQVNARVPQKELAQMRLSSILQMAREPERGGSGEFVFLGPNQLWRKPAAYRELEGVFRLFLARQPVEARERCERLVQKYRARDADVFKLAFLAKAWIAELSGELDRARGDLEELGEERGFESDVDRLSALARLYETDGGPALLEKAVNIYRHFAGRAERVSVLGHLAWLCRRLGRVAEAAAYEERFLELFRRRMHRSSFADTVRILARRYVPLYKLAGVRFADTKGPESPGRREEALVRALRGDVGPARELLRQGTERLDVKYLGDLAVLEGDLDGAVGHYLRSLDGYPQSLRVIEWLLDRQAIAPSAEIEAYFRDEKNGREASGLLESAIRESGLRPSLWRQLAALQGLRGDPEAAARSRERAAALEEAAARKSSPVGRVLAAAVYHYEGKPRGMIHEVWAERRPASAGRGGFLDEILGNLTPEMMQAVRNTFLSVREYARAKWPHRTRDILDYAYTYKVTKEDEPSGGLSAGLPSALAFLSVFLDRPVPQDMASSGVLVADSHDVLVVRPIGEAEFKVRGAYNRNLACVLLPEGNRPGLSSSPLVPAAICEEIVRFVPDLDAAVVRTFGQDAFLR